MTTYDIRIDWLDASGNVLPDAPAGYNVADFFEDRGEWMGADYARPGDAFEAADAEYKGRDIAGIGMQATIWDDSRRVWITQAIG